MYAVEAKNLSMRFDGKPVLEDITCNIAEGDFLAIVGPNGAGKSTLLRLILGLQRPSSGSLLVFERPPERVEPNWIGYVPQIKTLDRTFPALSIELVVSAMRRRWPWRIGWGERGTAMAALEGVGAAHLALRPLGKLSGGELQRVYLAYSMVRRPRLVIMDEPAAGIDVMGQKGLYNVLDEYHRSGGATILMVTHDWGVAHHHATRVMVLNRSLVSFGPPEAALKDRHLRRAYGHVGHSIFPAGRDM